MSKKKGNDILDGAYALKTPQDNRRYYKRIASIYDHDFAKNLNYIYPHAVAKAFLQMPFIPRGRICDIGCGTGLVAEYVKSHHANIEIDGIDISGEMLKVAAKKCLYKSLFEADLTADINNLPVGYTAMISAGTFTHGHLDPAPLRSLINHCQEGAAFCIGVNKQHFESFGFEKFFELLCKDGLITEPNFIATSIYSATYHESSQDLALICRFYVQR